MDKIAALQRTKLFGALHQKELEWMAAQATFVYLHAGEMLFLADEEAAGLFVIVDGKIRAFQQNAEGREQVMHVDTAGATIGDVPVFDDGPYPASAMAEEDSNLLFIRKQDIHKFCLKHPYFTLKALKLMAKRVRRHASLVKILSLHEVSQRLALFLLAEAKRAKRNAHGPITFRLELSNHQIAIRIGSVRDVVSRALAKFQEERLIANKRREITIIDLQALKRHANISQ